MPADNQSETESYRQSRAQKEAGEGFSEGKGMTDEELALYNKQISGPCPSCKSNMVSVRWAGGRWFYVGCTCFNKYQCEEKYIPECLERWNTAVRRANSDGRE